MRPLAAPLLAPLLALLALSACAPSVYDAPYPVRPVELPRDDAAHDAPIEWWYYTGHLETDTGEAYGFELTFFKAFVPPEIRLFGVYPLYYTLDRGHVAHFAVTDKTGRRFVMGERADFWGYSAGASTDELEVFVANWRAERAPDGVSHRIRAAEGGFSLDLTLTPTKPAALHGDPPGIQSMGPGGTSYYVSYTRMAATGTLGRGCGPLGLGCETLAVTGEAWHDHQWGDFDLSSYAGWDWFSVQFEDNTELMLYLIRAPSGAYTAQAGSLITASGETLGLDASDFSVTPTGATWTSPETGAVYPMGWRVEVPEHALELTVTPVFPEQEMNTRASTGIVYWEGAVVVEGSRRGVGYVELTNYDLYPYGQTDETTPLQPLRGPFGG
jgi:predicted secreted hydrolase